MPQQNVADLPSDSSNIMFADPTYNRPGPIDLIIGSDLYNQII
jgi:hypothetical protein